MMYFVMRVGVDDKGGLPGGRRTERDDILI